MSKLVSIVIPIFNEAEVIPLLRSKFDTFLTHFPSGIEIVLIDDGSMDQSQVLLNEWSAACNLLRIHRFDSNQGHQKALQKGLEMATGDLIVTMDADLQDPLEEIPQMIEKAREGFDIVHMRRASRKGESCFRRCAAWLYYRTNKTFFNDQILLDVGDFRLIRREALLKYLSLPNRRFLRGELVTMKCPQTVLPYHRHRRAAGNSKFSMNKLIKLARDGFLSNG